MLTPVWIILGAVGLVVLFVWFLYNGLVSLQTRIEEAWSAIDVQLKRRADLIPNLIESVKGYTKHEKGVFTEVTKARSALMNAKSPAQMGQANDMLTNAIGKLFAIAEAYPLLKANENFLHLQKELSDTEDKVAYSRQYYNSTVLEYNTKIRIFPNNLLANNLGFTPKEFFQSTDGERKGVKVKFD